MSRRAIFLLLVFALSFSIGSVSAQTTDLEARLAALEELSAGSPFSMGLSGLALLAGGLVLGGLALGRRR